MLAPAEQDYKILLRELYPELRMMAGFLVRRERPDHTLQRTALVHEAFLRLFKDIESLRLSREGFLALAGHQMRMILIDHARRHNAQRRGGVLIRVPLFESEHVWERDEDELVALGRALDRLAIFHARAASVVELKFFSGFTTGEIAAIHEVSDGTVESDWAYAKSWLYRELTKKPQLRV